MTAPPPPVDLDKIAATLAAATPGPWREGAQPYVYTEGVGGLPVVADCYNPADAAAIVAAVNAAPALIAELRDLRAKVAAVEAEIAEEDQYRDEDPAWEITVLVPLKAGEETWERIFDAVADAAHEAEPGDREDWDVFVSSVKQPAVVPVHLLRRALGSGS